MSTVLIDLLSNSMGDTIGVMPCIDEFRKINDKVIVRINPVFEKLFTLSYPDVIFFRENMTYDKSVKIHYDFTKPLQTGFAEQLGFFNWEYIKPKVDSFKKERPIKNKYVTISVHSTSQLKYWNHPNGIKSQIDSTYWSELCSLIRKKGYTPVVVERDELFGIPPFRNGLPKNANKKFGLSLEDTINHIEHSEFFIGLSSGLSWLAHALDKPVAMISNFSEDWHEFGLNDPKYKRITNKSVCHGCWNLVTKEFTFNYDDWYWCPRHRGTDRQFECHTSITPEMVMNEIEDWLI